MTGLNESLGEGWHDVGWTTEETMCGTPLPDAHPLSRRMLSRNGLPHVTVENPRTVVKARVVTHRHCPGCDVHWFGTPLCWLCGEPTGVKVAAPYIPDGWDGEIL